MPIVIDKEIPAYKILKEERTFVMDKERAVSQEIRPIEIAILNLMPTKEATETQFMRLLSNSPLQVNITLIKTSTYNATHVDQKHLEKFYKTFDEVKGGKFDGMIITGAPVEHMPFEEVEYWQELCEIMEWTKTHVHSTFHVCWGAQAGLYYHFGIQKQDVASKMFGVFPHRVEYKNSMLFRGFDDVFMVPQSRHTTVRTEDVLAVPGLKLLASSDETGVYAIATDGGRQVFITGHSEYDADTLKNEYLRDLAAGLNPIIPKNYFPDNDPEKQPLVTWRAHANLLWCNWLNYFVYQTTPYDISEIQ
jgi:homoserine O-succinyltransferase